MTNQKHHENPFFIPGKQAVFEALTSGKHISLHSGELYRFLEEHMTDYITELETLGYTLMHEQDFYYLQAREENKGSDYSKKALVFIAIMLESIAQSGRDMIETLYQSQGFERDRLPHFSTDRYRNYMQNLGIEDSKALNALLKSMHRSGFIEYHEPENLLRFLSPCQRFIQLALDVLEQHKKDQEL